MSEIKEEPNQKKRKELSVKYQVLTEETAMIGKIRNMANIKNELNKAQ